MKDVLITRRSIGPGGIQYFRNRTYNVSDPEAKRLVSRGFAIVVQASVQGTNTDPVYETKENPQAGLEMMDLFETEPEDTPADPPKAHEVEEEKGYNSGVLLKCKECNKQFPSPRGLDAHVRRAHPKEKK